MAYGYTPVSTASDTSLTAIAPPTSAESADADRSSASCFGHRSVVETSGSVRYLCEIAGNPQVFASFGELLKNPSLWGHFKHNFPSRTSNTALDFQSPYARWDVKNDVSLRQAFLSINHIQAVAGSEEAGVSSGSALYNSDMKECSRREVTLLSSMAKQYFKIAKLRGAFQNYKNLAGAGFYFSPSTLRPHCFSCGGNLQPDSTFGKRSVLKVHWELYPQCAYIMSQKKIQEFQKELSEKDRRQRAIPLPDHPNLYLDPLSDDSKKKERDAISHDAIQQLREQAAKHEKKSYNQNFSRADVSYNQNFSRAGVNSCIKALEKKIGPQEIDAFRRFTGKVRSAGFQGKKLGTFWHDILQKLLSFPDYQTKEIGGEIAAMIDSVESGDCQDHTAETLDQIKTRMLFLELMQKVGFEGGFNSLLKLLCELKLFFNETMLDQALNRTLDFNGVPLIAKLESTEIRGAIKNELAKICRFPGKTVLQCHGEVGRQSEEVMNMLKALFITGIENQDAFTKYLTDLLRTDEKFLAFYKKHDDDYATKAAQAESSAEAIMEDIDAHSTEVSDQVTRERLDEVARTRKQRLDNSLESSIKERVAEFWETIVRETEVVPSNQTA